MRFSNDRGVSIAVTHVLTVGITAVLISGLLIGASSMLEAQQERSTEESLETIGERLAKEMAAVDNTDDNATNVTVRTSHQRRVGGSQYAVTIREDCDQPLIESGSCLVLDSQGQDVTVAVPLKTETPLDDGKTVTGGEVVIKSDGAILTLEEPQ